MFWLREISMMMIIIITRLWSCTTRATCCFGYDTLGETTIRNVNTSRNDCLLYCGHEQQHRTRKIGPGINYYFVRTDNCFDDWRVVKYLANTPTGWNQIAKRRKSLGRWDVEENFSYASVLDRCWRKTILRQVDLECCNFYQFRQC